MNEPLITFASAANLIGPGATARTLRTWHEEGRLEAQRVGRQWRTTATKVREAIERGWQTSFSTAPTANTAHVRKHACDDISGTSNGMKGSGVASVARAMNLATELAQNKRLGGSCSHSDGRPKAPVIPLK